MEQGAVEFYFPARRLCWPRLTPLSLVLPLVSLINLRRFPLIIIPGDRRSTQLRQLARHCLSYQSARGIDVATRPSAVLSTADSIVHHARSIFCLKFPLHSWCFQSKKNRQSKVLFTERTKTACQSNVIKKTDRQSKAVRRRQPPRDKASVAASHDDDDTSL